MEAIIREGGRQFKVKEGATVDMDYREVEPGSKLEFGDVLYLATEGGASKIGTPTLKGAKVIGTVVGTVKGQKVIAAQFRRRKDSRRRVGHRQKYTKVRIDSIQA